MKKILKRICENLDWNIREYETDIELAKYSPAGEDFFFTVNKTNFVDEVIIYAEEFDADEHAEMWVNNMHEVKGVPQSIRTLIEDADAIKEMLLELATELCKAYKEALWLNLIYLLMELNKKRLKNI